MIKLKLNDIAVRRELSRFQRIADNLSPILNQIGVSLQSSHGLRWEQQKTPNGEQWKPLSPRYKQWKAKNYPSVANKILILHGNLRKLKLRTTNDSVFLGADKIYAKTHQYGDSSRNIPKREFLGFSSQDEKDILKAVKKYFV